MTESRCPVCGAAHSAALYPDYNGPCITSQLDFLEECRLDNRCCLGCGFIFNAAGVRGRTGDVYTAQHWRPKPQVLSFGQGVKSQQERALDIFESLCPLPPAGRILDFGAGRGYFLEHFAARHPGWEMYAIEPGGGQCEHAQRIPAAVSYGVPYDNVDLPYKMDCIVVMSVLEHLENPLAALHWIRRHLAEGGIVCMQHPDFACLPGDVFCADHIGKLTVPYTEALCAYAGLPVLHRHSGGVMFSLICSAGSPVPLHTDVEQQQHIARAAEHIARASVACVGEALASARKYGGQAAVFGTSPVGSMAPLMLGAPDAVRWLVDENANTWGRTIGAACVIGPDRMAECGITDVALAISPAYWDVVTHKLERFAVRVHRPDPAEFPASSPCCTGN